MKSNKDKLKSLKTGLRLITKPPKREVPKNKYNRKPKHKDDPDYKERL